ncbi:unnamed protein product [Clavelina lepadiformis]|uniref:C2H2-type domain-containing protein n=1 Tax=Clavelina lepadiformis TaxID=159417 RepID=A0ABP0GX82_CLALP
MDCVKERLSDHVGMLILEELKLIRQEMNAEFQKLQQSLSDFFLKKSISEKCAEPVVEKTSFNIDSNEANVSMQLCGYDNTLMEYDFDNGQWPIETVDLASMDACNELLSCGQGLKADNDCKLVKTESMVKNLTIYNAVDDTGICTANNYSHTVNPVNKGCLSNTGTVTLKRNEFQEDLSSLQAVKRKRNPPRDRNYPTEEWLCIFCSKSCPTENGLKQHLLRLHNNNSIFTSNIVTRKENLSNTVDNDKKIEALDLERSSSTVVCKHSEIRTNQPKMLDRGCSLAEQHATSQMSQYNFICMYCKKGFVGFTGLKAHIFVHTKPFKCLTCGKGHGQRRKLRQHLTSRNNSYASSKSLKRHMTGSHQLTDLAIVGIKNVEAK